MPDLLIGLFHGRSGAIPGLNEMALGVDCILGDADSQCRQVFSNRKQGKLMKDLRKHSRYRTGECYLVYDRNSDKLLGRAVNMSLGGFMIVADDPVPEGVTLECRITFPEMIEDVQQLDLEVTPRWCTMNERMGWYEIGLQCEPLPTEKKDLLATVVQQGMAVQSDQLNAVGKI